MPDFLSRADEELMVVDNLRMLPLVIHEALCLHFGPCPGTGRTRKLTDFLKTLLVDNTSPVPQDKEEILIKGALAQDQLDLCNTSNFAKQKDAAAKPTRPVQPASFFRFRYRTIASTDALQERQKLLKAHFIVDEVFATHHTKAQKDPELENPQFIGCLDALGTCTEPSRRAKLNSNGGRSPGATSHHRPHQHEWLSRSTQTHLTRPLWGMAQVRACWNRYNADWERLLTASGSSLYDSGTVTQTTPVPVGELGPAAFSGCVARQLKWHMDSRRTAGDISVHRLLACPIDRSVGNGYPFRDGADAAALAIVAQASQQALEQDGVGELVVGHSSNQAVTMQVYSQAMPARALIKWRNECLALKHAVQAQKVERERLQATVHDFVRRFEPREKVRDRGVKALQEHFWSWFHAAALVFVDNRPNRVTVSIAQSAGYW
ncbi:uncharacterized protein MYCFIDRAFT_180479 [Pseudocercospora fijiensis CIRAD86]|uniref:Uncharacterized protein n=1 Tax=Pseudocercospora fijiensis (strain CIRAD86) TaxID=383855 RepID=M2YGQ9_PSEFD|nr:uncharacterized protein MYCFIDRAFT_180479 [Pseudocercospora fijiensis CIRAD86]EME76995.1 hypothetical protein MYCFIDRAFT_180479 [Pseudocercospora fijiensis CIRAD86]